MSDTPLTSPAAEGYQCELSGECIYGYNCNPVPNCDRFVETGSVGEGEGDKP